MNETSRQPHKKSDKGAIAAYVFVAVISGLFSFYTFFWGAAIILVFALPSMFSKERGVRLAAFSAIAGIAGILALGFLYIWISDAINYIRNQ